MSLGSDVVAYRAIGEGFPLLMIHGWPLSSETFRYLVPSLAPKSKCYLVDLPGAGESNWTAQTNFTFLGRAQLLKTFVDQLGLAEYDILAQDTGATIARYLALIDRARVRKLASFNTEIPGHRPPWIPLYQILASLPGSDAFFRIALRSRLFTRSSLGFGGCFWDKDRISGEFATVTIKPLINSRKRMLGQLHALQGIDWRTLDELGGRHRELTMPVLLVWGEDDPTFPIRLAREMALQFPRLSGFHPVPRSKLLVHEERPAAVSQVVLDFLGRDF